MAVMVRQISSTVLTGLQAIADYMERSTKTVQRILAAEDDFPAAKVRGSWVSDKVMIDDWLRRQIDAQRTPVKGQNRTSIGQNRTSIGQNRTSAGQAKNRGL